MGITNEAMKIDKIIDVFERLNDINDNILHICAFPILMIWVIVTDIQDERDRKKRQKNEIADEKKILREKIENGEVSMADLPHNRRENDNVFSFKNDDYNPLLHKVGHFVYIENEYNEALQRFFKEKQDVIKHWEEWYGCKLVFVNQEEFLNGLCFPQDRKYLRHGLMYNGGCSTGDIEYGVTIRPWAYVELVPEVKTPLEEQFNLIAQHLIEMEYNGHCLNVKFE